MTPEMTAVSKPKSRPPRAPVRALLARRAKLLLRVSMSGSFSHGQRGRCPVRGRRRGELQRIVFLFVSLGGFEVSFSSTDLDSAADAALLVS